GTGAEGFLLCIACGVGCSSFPMTVLFSEGSDGRGTWSRWPHLPQLTLLPAPVSDTPSIDLHRGQVNRIMDGSQAVTATLCAGGPLRAHPAFLSSPKARANVCDTSNPHKKVSTNMGLSMS